MAHRRNARARWFGFLATGLSLAVGVACGKVDKTRDADEGVRVVHQALEWAYTPPPQPDVEAYVEDSIVPTPTSQGEVAGKLLGVSNVEQDGSFSYTIPLRVPDGVNGLQPELSLRYNSRGGESGVGIGWSVSGLSQISRCRKVLAIDEKVDGVEHAGADSFCLDGVKLMLTGGSYGQPGSEYRSERADYAKVKAYGSTGDGPEHFIVWGKDGRVREYRPVGNPIYQELDRYGNPLISRPATPVWMLTKLSDRLGNSIDYEYLTSFSTMPAISRISYAGGSRVIIFNQTPNLSGAKYEAGVALHGQRHTVSTVSMYAPYTPPSSEFDPPGGLLWTYKLGYDQTPVTGRYRLTTVRWCDANDVCLPETEFAWAGFEDYLDPEYQLRWESEIVEIDSELSHWTHTQLVDVTGDGRDDLIYSVRHPDQADGSTCGAFYARKIKVFLRVSDGQSFGERMDISDFFQNSADPAAPRLHKMRTGDFDGDGTPELLVPYQEHTGALTDYRLLTWDADTERLVEEADGESFLVSGPYDTLEVADGDGDGRTDIFLFDPSLGGDDWGAPWQFFRTIGPYQLAPPVLMPEASAVFTTAMDVRGDGRVEVYSDALPIGPDENGAPEGWQLPDPGDLTFWDPQNYGDINGDGLKDVVRLDGNEIRVWLNTGRGFTDDYEAASGEFAGSTDMERSSIAMADFNADGRDDIIVWSAYPRDFSPACSIAPYDAEPRILLSDGLYLHDMGTALDESMFSLAMLPRWAHVGTFEGPHGFRGHTVGDIDGDGTPEVLTLEGDDLSGHMPDDLRFRLWSLDRDANGDRIVQIEDGLGESQWIRYETLTDPVDSAGDMPATYLPGEGCQWPQRCLKRGMTVVRQFSIANGGPSPGHSETRRSWEYRYEDGRTDVAGRGFLGFRCVTTRDQETGAVTKRCTDNATRMQKACPGWIYPYAGLPDVVEVRQPLGDGTDRVRVTRTDYTWKPPRWMNHAVYSIELDRTLSEVREGVPDDPDLVDAEVVLSGSAVSTVDTRFTFDDMGNQVEQYQVRQANGETSSTRTIQRYDNLTDDRWLIGLMSRSEVEHSRSGEPARWNRTGYTYKPDTKLLESITTEPDAGDDIWSRTVLVRKASGVIERVENSAKLKTTRVTRFGYDEDDIHVRRVENAVGHVAWIGMHPGLGQPAVVVDPNGVTTSFQYDGFGRIRHVDEPHDGDTSYEYGDSLLASSFGVGWDALYGMSVRLVQTGGNDNLMVLDHLGRPVHVSWETFDNERGVIERSYDRFGRLGGKTLAHEIGDAPEGSTSTTFDLLGRPLTITNPDGTTVNASYPSFFRAEVEDEEGRRRFLVAGLDGLVERSGSLDGSREVFSRFDHDVVGNLKTITDAEGHVTKFERDVLGRVTRVEDPDRGVERSFYNGFSEMRESWHGARLPANPNDFIYRTLYQYDDLGRLIDVGTDCTASSQCRDEHRTFTWDDAPNAAGQLVSAHNVVDDVVTEFNYDELGRPFREIQSVLGSTLAVDTGYDLFGRHAATYYRDTASLDLRFFTANLYGTDGFLESVRSEERLLWRATTRTVEGFLSGQEQSADEFATTPTMIERTLDYDPLTRRLEALDSTVIDGSGPDVVHQLLEFDYYDDGMLQTRSEYRSYSPGADPGSPDILDSYSYDYASRLKTWLRPTADLERTFEYSDSGNIDRAETEIDGSASTESYSYGQNGAGPRSVTALAGKSYGYDAAGRQVTRSNGSVERRLSYTDFDLPHRAEHVVDGETVVTTFKYDAFGRRAAKSTEDAATLYLGDLYEQRRQGVDVQHTFFVHSEPGAVAQVTQSDDETEEEILFIHGDLLGSASTILNADGSIHERLQYSPFGERIDDTGLPTPSSSPVTRGFTGHEHDDDLGLVNMKGRLYDPKTRRFMTPDPLVGSPLALDGWNPFTYVLNSPTAYIDPSGFQAEFRDGVYYFEDDRLEGKAPASQPQSQPGTPTTEANGGKATPGGNSGNGETVKPPTAPTGPTQAETDAAQNATSQSTQFVSGTAARLGDGQLTPNRGFDAGSSTDAGSSQGASQDDDWRNAPPMGVTADNRIEPNQVLDEATRHVEGDWEFYDRAGEVVFFIATTVFTGGAAWFGRGAVVGKTGGAAAAGGEVIRLPQSLGAAARDIIVRTSWFARGGGKIVGRTITGVREIASGRGIREVSRLVGAYGGKAANWRKMSGITQVETAGGAVRTAEVHWYQAHGVGRVEFKVKAWLP